MFAQVPSIKNRLATALGAAWLVVDGTDPQDRRELPRADVRLAGAVIASTSGPGVLMQARYTVRLVVDAQGSTTPFALLDSAVTTAIAALHYWRPEGANARLTLQDMAEADFMDASLFGYDMAFTLSVQRDGSND